LYVTTLGASLAGQCAPSALYGDYAGNIKNVFDDKQRNSDRERERADLPVGVT
jgi:hypothetical protein